MASYLSEQYAVRHHWVKKILLQFKIDPIYVRDCFATVHNRRFEKFWDASCDALLQAWDCGEVRWCNPPWSLWPRVADKILSSAGTSIAVLPAWHSQPWVNNLLQAAVVTIYYGVGSKIFELGDKAVAGIKWGLYVLRIDILQPSREVYQVATWSSSSRRRYRRKLLRSSTTCPSPRQ